MKKRLAFEVKVSRTFTIEGEDYCKNWETFKRELNLLCTTVSGVRWEMPSKHVKLREFTSHHDLVFYAAHEECPNCFCDDTLSFKLTEDETGHLDPMAECSNCGFKKLFCAESPGSPKCVECLHRVQCLVKEDELK